MLYLTLSLTLLLALVPNPNVMSTVDIVIVSCCSTGNYSNIDNVLQHAQSVKGKTTIHIQPGNHTLSGSYEFQSKSGISIFGSGEDSTILNCDWPGNGIAFINSNQIEIRDLSIVGCGAKYKSPSRNMKNCTQFLPFQVALYFEFCKNVNVSNISIRHSNGTGLAFLNTVGNVEISHSEFTNNGVLLNKQTQTPGGGGVFIDFTSNAPGELPSVSGVKNKVKAPSMLKATYHISGCKFLENQATPGNVKTTHISPCCNDGNSFPFLGRGGGMTVYFNENASGNSISISGCTLFRNSAELGGGLFVSFLGSSNNNKVEIDSNTFESNNSSMEPSVVSQYSSGGGARINFISNMHGNQATFSNNNFTNNSAHWGGGLSLYSETVPQGERATDKVEIRNCRFVGNIARIGAAVDMFCNTFDNILSQECPLTPAIIDCKFVNHGRMYTYQDGSRGSTYAVANLDHLPAIFCGNITFYDNEGSALGVRETVVQVMSFTFLTFTRNTGRNGGGIVFMGNSWMVLHENTYIFFDSNAAIERGGAIYATQLLNCYMAYSYSCFVRYIKPTMHPNNWNVTLQFRNNSEFALGPAKRPNSIYASSILPCVWPSSADSDLQSDINATFCDWNSWKFDTEGNCTVDITSSAASFGTNEYNIAVYAGIQKQLHVDVYDDFKQPVTKGALFAVSSELDTHLQSIELTNNFITGNNTLTVHGDPNTHSSILLQTLDTRTVYSKVNIHVFPCPPGHRLENTSGSMTCKCPKVSGDCFTGYVVCQQDSESLIFVGYCISYSEIEIKGTQFKEVIVSKCPFFSGLEVSEPTISLPTNVSELDDRFCTNQWNRTGKLCNKCSNGTGISVFSSTFKCIECTESVTNWLIYIAVTILPLTLFFIIVVIFHVGVTSPQANGYIFFSQCITIPLQELLIEAAWALALPHDTTKQQILTNLLLFPYSVWSFDFFRIFHVRDICLHKSMRIIHVLALQYIPALYPLCLVIISYILIELHARNCRPVVWLWKPFCFLCVRFRRNWEAKTSIIDAFATFLLLSYTKILLVSFSLLTPTDIIINNGTSVGKILNNDPSVDFFTRDHLPYAILALVILVTLGAIPPLLLLLYPSHTFQRFLSFFKLQSHGLQTFVDAFQGCYKNRADGGPERRYFAGIYFVFRIIVFLIFTVVSSITIRVAILQVAFTIFILIFVIFRPYKKDQYNILDPIFIMILAVTCTATAVLYIYLLICKSLLNPLWYFTYALLHIPTLYMAGYIIYWFCTHSRCIQTHCISKINRQNHVDYASDHYHRMGQASHFILHSVSSFPDRIQNPHHYTDLSDSLCEEHENASPHTGRRRESRRH